MNIAYDLQLKDGTEINGCYFKKVIVAARNHSGRIIVTYDKAMLCFDTTGEEIKDICLEDAHITKVYDEETNQDFTGLLSTIVYRDIIKLY